MRALERDAAYYFVGKACAALGVLAAIPLTTRVLDTGELAEYALWSAAALWTSTAAVGWLQTGVQRFHRERRLAEQDADYLASVRVALRWGALASAAAVVLAALVCSSLPATAVLAIGALSAASSLYLGHQAMTQAELAAKRVVASDIARGLALPLVLVLVAVCGASSVATVTLAQAIGLFAAVALLAAGSPMRREGGRARTHELVALARYGLPLGVWLVITLANAHLGRVALQAFGLPAELATYAALHDVVIKAGTLVLMPVVYAVQGHVMAAWAEGNRTAVRRSLRRAFVLQGAVALVLVVGFAVCAGPIMAVLFDRPPTAGSPVVTIAALAGGVAFANLGLLAHKGLEIGQRTRTMLLLALVALALDAVLCCVLVPVAGALGAALAYLAAQVCYAALAHVCSRRVLARLVARPA